MSLYTVIAAFLLALIGVAVWAVAFLVYIARGEPDVNGDPERDAGRKN